METLEVGKMHFCIIMFYKLEGTGYGKGYLDVFVIHGLIGSGTIRKYGFVREH